MRKSLALSIATASIAGVGALVPAAANAAGTSLTSTVGISGPGVVAIVPPVAMTLTQSGSTLASTGLDTSTVTDTRVGSGSWTVSVNVSDLSLTGASPAVTIPASTNASLFTTAPSVLVPGTATVTDNYVGSGNKLSLTNTDKPLMTATTTNANTVTFNSTLQFSVPANTPMGVYTGTLNWTVG